MKRYIKSNNEFYSRDVETYSQAKVEVMKALKAGTTLEDIFDYLDEIRDDNKISYKEYKELAKFAINKIQSVKASEDDFIVRTPKKVDEAFLNYRATKVSKHMPKAKQAELRKLKAQYKDHMQEMSQKCKQYVYRCVAESPQVPDPDEGEEAWTAYTKDASEYKAWCFADAVEDGLFEDTDDDYNAFEKLWKQAETDMAQPYA